MIDYNLSYSWHSLHCHHTLRPRLNDPIATESRLTSVGTLIPVLMSFPSSQSSPAAALTIPSPQADVVQLALQPGLSPLSSHCSPAVVLSLPSPSRKTTVFIASNLSRRCHHSLHLKSRSSLHRHTLRSYSSHYSLRFSPASSQNSSAALFLFHPHWPRWCSLHCKQDSQSHRHIVSTA